MVKKNINTYTRRDGTKVSSHNRETNASDLPVLNATNISKLKMKHQSLKANSSFHSLSNKNKIPSSKFKSGDLVKKEDRGWDGDEIKANLIIVDAKFVDESNIVGFGEEGWWYRAFPTKDSVDALWGVDKDDYAQNVKNPAFNHESWLEKGHYPKDDLGYQ